MARLKIALELTSVAVAGFAGGANPYVYSSPNYYAFEFGAYLNRSGRPEPRDVRMSRGYSIREADIVYKFDLDGGVKFDANGRLNFLRA